MTAFGYQDVQVKREELSSLIEAQLKVTAMLGMETWQPIMAQLRDRVLANNFKVLVIGEFKRGKSTLINAMLGDEILPAWARPCTAIINEIKWAEAPRAVLHYSQKSDRAPEEIPFKDLERYVVIDDTGAEGVESPYAKVELFWPLSLCRDGVEIIDSPGLNESWVRQQITMEYLATVDAVLFVLSCRALASQSELDVVDNSIRPSGHEDIFFVCNMFNSIRAKEREDVRQYGLRRLAGKTKHGSDRVFFVDAQDALDGRIAADVTLIDGSNMAGLEKELEYFLANERGRAKIIGPAAELKRSIREVRRVIPEREGMLKTDLETLERRYEETQEPLRQLEARRRQIVTRLDHMLDDSRQRVDESARAFLTRVANEVPGWAMEYEIKNPIKLFKASPSQTQAVVGEIMEHLTTRFEAESAAWQTGELRELSAEQLALLRQELEARMVEFVERIDEVRLTLSGVDEGEWNIALEDKKVGAVERVLSAAGGLLIAGPGAAFIGATGGYKELVKSIGPQVIVAATAFILIGVNPVSLVVLLAGGLLHKMTNLDSENRQIKQKVGDDIAAQIRDSRSERAAMIADEVRKQLANIRDLVDQGLNNEITGIRDQVKSVRAEKHKGAESVDQQMRLLAEARRSLEEIDSKLDQMIEEVALA